VIVSEDGAAYILRILESSGKLQQLQEKGGRKDQYVYCSLLPSHVSSFIHYIQLAESTNLER
jgi:hypothetical protein